VHDDADITNELPVNDGCFLAYETVTRRHFLKKTERVRLVTIFSFTLDMCIYYMSKLYPRRRLLYAHYNIDVNNG